MGLLRCVSVISDLRKQNSSFATTLCLQPAYFLSLLHLSNHHSNSHPDFQARNPGVFAASPLSLSPYLDPIWVLSYPPLWGGSQHPTLQESSAPPNGYPEEGVTTHSSVLAWRIPMNRGAWWALVHGVQRVRYDWATKHTHMKQTCVSYSFEQEFLESLLSGAEKIEVWETKVEFWNETSW